MLATFVRFIRDCVCETQKELLRLMGESITIDGEGVKALLSAIRDSSGKRANELVVLIGKSVQSVERYVKTLKDSGEVEFRGAPIPNFPVARFASCEQTREMV